MKFNALKASLAIAAVGITGTAGADVAILNETPLEHRAEIAGERIEARQVGNVVETTLPWKDAAPIKVKYDLGNPTARERAQDKRKQEVITEIVDFGEGGFKMDILLNEKPDTNIFCYDIENHQDYDFFYQGELTPEEIADGAERPEDIVGSYAVYHKTKRDHVLGEENYATGKVMHIPRPEVWELNNPTTTREWAELSYNEGELCVTVSALYLEEANYPVRVDPTFGYTTLGGSSNVLNNTSNFIRRGNVFTTTESGALDSITVGLGREQNSSETVHFFLHQINSAGANSHGEIAEVSGSLSLTTSGQFFTQSTSGQSISASTDYVISVAPASFAPAADQQTRYYYDGTSSGTEINDQVTTFAELTEDPWNKATYTGTIFRMSIYATYTATGGDTPAETFVPHQVY